MISLFDFYKIKKKQKDVEFVIPLLDTDRKFFIDPSLVKFSHKNLQIKIEKYITILNKYILSGDTKKVIELLNIGESRDIGFGYCKKGTGGSGLGKEVSKRTIDLILKNNDFKKKGLTRLEELQWLDTNIGPDRISDLVGNILKEDLILYTKKISKKYNIPTQDVRIQKIFDFKNEKWIMQSHNVPVNELIIIKDVFNPHPPVLLIPTTVAKMLPLFLDYDGYYGFVDPKYKKTGKKEFIKTQVRDKTLDNPSISLDYINIRESNPEKLYKQDFNTPGPDLYEKLDNIPSGQKHANEYRSLIREIFEYIFENEISLIKEEKATYLKENRMDIVFSNDGSSQPFSNFRLKYYATNLIIDTKNTDSVTSKDVAQVSNYLTKRRGMVGFIVSRKSQTNLKSHQVEQLKNHEKIIIHISNEELKCWLKEKMRISPDGEVKQRFSPLKALNKKYKDIELS